MKRGSDDDGRSESTNRPSRERQQESPQESRQERPQESPQERLQARPQESPQERLQESSQERSQESPQGRMQGRPQEWLQVRLQGWSEGWSQGWARRWSQVRSWGQGSSALRAVLCGLILFFSGIYFGARLPAAPTAGGDAFQIPTTLWGIGEGASESDPIVYSFDPGTATLDPSVTGSEQGATAPDSGATAPGPDSAVDSADSANLALAVFDEQPCISPRDLLAEIRWPVDGRLSREPCWMYVDAVSAWKFLPGVDIAADPRSAVTAVLDGVVREVGQDPVLGIVVAVEHEVGLQTLYGGLAAVNKSVGDRVAAGEVIGLSGSDHLYFEIICDGERLNPVEYLRKTER